MAETKTNKAEQKDLAKWLYLQGHYTQKEIATKVGFSENTISKWANDEQWDSLKKSLTTTKAEQLAFLYEIFAKMTAEGKAALEDDDPKTNPDLDGIAKISKAIERLEKEASIGEMMQTLMLFLKFLKVECPALVKDFNKWSMVFIQEQMAKSKS